ncbi:hypothetical protein [Nocardiopsis alborubida]|uniref:Uncharacterized protein n=1 Tax=Nocardiopsis alborubida TaxID=146802 RepID=A0A7X6ME88_9ACTN|nr:hypothetical protein [Nocardiopsis alborubida]NKY98959.1 hypothetical protein [Nocardiopsis alborubida]
MSDISPMYTVFSFSSFVSLFFEGLYLLFGITVLALTGVVAADRRKLVATGGALLVLGALGDLAVQIWSFYALYMGMAPAANLLHLVFTLVFLGGLLTLVLAAVRRVPGPAAPPPPGPRPGPHPSPTR